MLGYNEQVLLTEDTVLQGEFGTIPPIYHLIGTRSEQSVTINAAEGTPAGTTVSGQQALLTAPEAAHPDGLAVFTLRVSTPPSGITPEQSVGYFSVFDAQTGAHVSLSAPFNVEWLQGGLVAYTGGAIRFADCISFTTITQAGTMTQVPLPGTGGAYIAVPCVTGHVVNNKALIVSSGEACESIYVVDVVTEATLSQSPCISELYPKLGGWMFNGDVYGIPGTPNFFSAATGQPIQGAAKTEGTNALTGVRSDLVLANSSNGPSYFLSTSSWQQVFGAPSEDAFRAYGMADDDVWVEGAAGRVVIDGRTGATLATSWQVAPEAGGTGWTVAYHPDICCISEYLLRSNGTMLESNASAP